MTFHTLAECRVSKMEKGVVPINWQNLFSNWQPLNWNIWNNSQTTKSVKVPHIRCARPVSHCTFGVNWKITIINALKTFCYSSNLNRWCWCTSNCFFYHFIKHNMETSVLFFPFSNSFLIIVSGFNDYINFIRIRFKVPGVYIFPMRLCNNRTTSILNQRISTF
jgi:hypothetical protein